MTPDQLQEAAAELVRRTTAAQGLPERIEDQSTLERVAGIVHAEGPVREEGRGGDSPGLPIGSPRRAHRGPG